MDIRIGKIIDILGTRQISEKFKTRRFVIGTKEYPLPFEAHNKWCDALDKLKVGDMVSVSFEIKGVKWNKNGEDNYLVNLVTQNIKLLSREGEVDFTEEVKKQEVDDCDTEFDKFMDNARATFPKKEEGPDFDDLPF